MRKFRYDWYLALAGLGLPVLGTVLEALTHLGSLSPGALLAAHAGQPLLWIMDTTPVVLGGLGRIIVRQHRDLVRQSEEIVRLEQARRDGLTRTASQLFQAAQGLLGNVHDFSSTTAETAASVRETAATMNRLSHTASAAALTAERVIGLALRSERESEQGIRHAKASGAELLRLAADVRALSARVEALSSRMRDVLAVATILSGVSERAERVAALAASAPGTAEAARLPEELRALSGDTRRAADEVKGMLAEVHQAVRAAVSAAESSSARAVGAADVAARTGEVIEGLAGALRESAGAAREIALVAQRQERAVERALEAMNEIAVATADSVQSGEHVAREARSVNALASSLQTAVKA